MVFAAIVAVILIYFIYRFSNRNKYVGTASSSPTAFGKLADAEGKIIALKAATKAKKADVDEAHADLDELHDLLG